MALNILRHPQPKEVTSMALPWRPRTREAAVMTGAMHGLGFLGSMLGLYEN